MPPVLTQTNTFKKDSVDASAKVLSAFQGTIKPVPVNGLYLIGALISALTMCLLPLIYFSMIGYVAYFTYNWAANIGSVFSAAGRVRNAKAMVVVVFIAVAPVLLGIMLVLFMLKPLVARRGKQMEPRKLNKAAEPFLFAFVEKICKAVGAPVPSEIHVDCEINASASFRRGMLGVFTNDLVLTIGLPLAGGLTMREFAGVLAHEFGHFSQPVGMRLTYFIRSMDAWFARLVFERDAFDYKLEEWLDRGSEAHFIFAIFGFFARLFVALTRGILWCLLMAGHAVSCFMLRQMEFDADRYEACLAGSEAFESTVRKLAVLNVANAMAQSSLSAAWDEGRLADDLPRLINSNIAKIPKKTHDALVQNLWSTDTGYFDTHPSDKDRLIAIKKEKSAPIFLVALPASDLFRDFKATARTVSMDFYKAVLDEQVKPENIRPVEELIATEEASDAGYKVLCRYSQANLLPLRQLPFKETLLKPPADVNAQIASLTAAREKMKAMAPAYREALKKWDEADTKALKASVAKMLVAFDVTINPKDYDLPDATAETVNTCRQKAREAMNDAARLMIEFENIAADRLHAALQLLLAPEMESKIPDLAKLREEAIDLLPLTEFFGTLVPSVIEIRDEHAELNTLLVDLEENKSNEAYCNRILLACTNLHMKLQDMWHKLGNVVYPFDHVKGVVTMREIALPVVPDENDVGKMHYVAGSIQGRVFNVYFRLMGRLGVLAEKAEVAAGFAPFPELPTPEEEEAARRKARAAARESARREAQPAAAATGAKAKGGFDF
ncbi:MAG TPA: M48 family metalloprotease [Planctomycetota bacterium]|nr:M48 family metalloprotease [Planctomycetota bacterium]